MNGFERIHECVANWTDAGQWELTNEPIVRCEDCRHVHKHISACGTLFLCDLSPLYRVDPDFFCAWGETKDGGSDEHD